MHSDKVAEAYAADPMTLMDDLQQLLFDDNHKDLAVAFGLIMNEFDRRRVIPGRGRRVWLAS